MRRDPFGHVKFIVFSHDRQPEDPEQGPAWTSFPICPFCGHVVWEWPHPRKEATPNAICSTCAQERLREAELDEQRAEAMLEEQRAMGDSE